MTTDNAIASCFGTRQEISMKKTARTATQRKQITRPAGLKIKTNVRAAGMQMQHNPTRARA